jgi:hypothetical protein
MPSDKDAVLPPVRLPRTLLDAARAQAVKRDETISQVVRRALRAYVASGPRQTDLEDAIAASKHQAPAPRASKRTTV